MTMVAIFPSGGKEVVSPCEGDFPDIPRKINHGFLFLKEVTQKKSYFFHELSPNLGLHIKKRWIKCL